jgi:hypothetical protein
MLFKSKKADFDINESILVDIITKRFDELEEKLDKLLFLNGVHADMNLEIQEYDNEIKVISGGRGRE